MNRRRDKSIGRRAICKQRRRQGQQHPRCSFWSAVGRGVALVLLLPAIQVMELKYVNPPFTPLMIKRHFEQKHDPLHEVHFEKEFVPIEQISPHLINAVNRSEDKSLFMYHRGFIADGLIYAYTVNQEAASIIRGGSCISQQTAKNYFTFAHKTVFRKVVETYYTFLIEQMWGKKRIMECYLNCVELGNGIYGCEAASQHYFHHSANDLTMEEAASLAATLPQPLNVSPLSPSEQYTARIGRLCEDIATLDPIEWEADSTSIDLEKVLTGERGLFFFLKWVSLHELKNLLNE